MNKKLLFLGLIIMYFIIACSSNKLIEISDSTECQTTIEGNFYSPTIFKYYSPAILFPNKSKVTIKYGNVIKKDEKGVFFKEEKRGVLGRSDTLYFRYDEMRAIVDSNKYCVWGKLDENEKGSLQIKITLKYLENPEYAPIYLSLTKDKNFAYCALPGNYEITNITMDYPKGNTEMYYKSYSDRIAKFEVKPGVANYIGEIKLLSDIDFDNVSLSVPYKKLSSGESAASAAGLVFGVAGGLIADAIKQSGNANADSAGVFKFNIIHDKGYKSNSKSIVEKRIIEQVNK
jgi:hypothetical protein